MRAAVTTAEGTLEILDVPDPAADGRVIVRVERAGICGTDLKILSGAIPVRRPLVLGHEIYGRVVEPAPDGLITAGRPVLVDPTVSCGQCRVCRDGGVHLCARGGLMGRELDGGFAELVSVDERQLHPVPEHVGPDEAALLQVLGTCAHGQDRIEVMPGRPAAVIGLGVTGLLHAQMLRARGAAPIIAITRSEQKRRKAEELGAHLTATPESAAASIAEATHGEGVDVVVESVGTTATLRQAVEIAGLGAQILMYGIISEARADLPFYDLYFKELDLVSSRAATPRDYQAAIDLVAAGLVKVQPLISASHPLSEADQALDRIANEPGVLKVILDITEATGTA